MSFKIGFYLAYKSPVVKGPIPKAELFFFIFFGDKKKRANAFFITKKCGDTKNSPKNVVIKKMRNRFGGFFYH